MRDFVCFPLQIVPRTGGREALSSTVFSVIKNTWDPFQWSEMCLNETISPTIKAAQQFSWCYYWNNLLLLFSSSWFDFITIVWMKVTVERTCRLGSVFKWPWLSVQHIIPVKMSETLKKKVVISHIKELNAFVQVATTVPSNIHLPASAMTTNHRWCLEDGYQTERATSNLFFPKA